MRRFVFALALGLAPVGAFAIFGNPSAVVNSSFKSVGELGNVDGGGNFSFVASAVAIDPYWILTARHIDGNAIRLNGSIFHAVEDYAASDSDLRLIKVDAPITDYAKLAKSDATGQTARLVGYGGTGSGITGNAYNVGGSDGNRHRANNRLEGYEAISFDESQTPWNAYWYDLDDPAMTGNRIVTGEGGVWFGDSGGGWFVQGSTDLELVAVSSAIFNPAYPDGGHENEFGSYGYGTRLIDQFGFIGQHVPGAVPEPGTVAAMGLGLAALLRRRRGRER